MRNLQKDQKLFEMYDQVVQEQLAEGVVERVTEEVNFGQQEFYLLHKAVICENAESTKLRTKLYMMCQPGKAVEAFH